MITSNVFHRTFFIKGDKYGTAFSIDVEGRQYLVTAKHLFDNALTVSSLKVFIHKRWIDVEVSFTGAALGEVDLVVFSPASRLSPNLLLEPSNDGMVLGQDVYFVGFPLKMWTDVGDALLGRPCPFIKKGTLSSAFDSGDGINRLYIDAFNNQGFSGAPIVFQPPGKADFQIAGVVSKFKTEFEPVIDKEGEKTDYQVEYNTGFLVGFSIQYALELIAHNPNGLVVKD